MNRHNQTKKLLSRYLKISKNLCKNIIRIILQTKKKGIKFVYKITNN